MELHFLDEVSIVFVRFGMLVRAIICLIMYENSSKSLDRTRYRGEYKGYMGVFLGHFKLTPSMLGAKLVILNWMVVVMFATLLINVWDEVAKGLTQ